MTKEELIESLTILEEQAREFGDDTFIRDIKIDSFNFVIDSAIKALSAIDKIKNDIENYPNFILCADGQKGIHIDEALKIIDKYTGGGKVE